MPGGAEAGVSLGISAKTGAGLDSLRWKLLEIAGWNPGAESPWLARERHLRALDDARGHLIRSEEHTSELQSLMRSSYAVFCLKKKITTTRMYKTTQATAKKQQNTNSELTISNNQ